MWSIETFEHEMKKFDPMLRLRESKIEPGVLFIERKAARETKCVPAPSDRQKIDVYRRNAEGHVLVCKVMKNELGKHLLLIYVRMICGNIEAPGRLLTRSNGKNVNNARLMIVQ